MDTKKLNEKYRCTSVSSLKRCACAFLAMIISVAGTACSDEAEKSSEPSTDNSSEVIFVMDDKQDDETVKEEEVTQASFNMSVAGDYIIYDSMFIDANNNAGGEGYDFAPMVENLRQFTEKCDVNYYNQETILGGTEYGISSYPCFVSPQEAGDAMVNLGYNLVSTATNHSLDGGEQAILNSCEYWKRQENVFMTGTFASQEERDAIHILECNGITYTMLNYTYSTNGIPVPEGKEYLVNVWPTDLAINDPQSDAEYQSYKQQVKKDIDAVRDKVDFLIVAVHAGVEYAPLQSAYQEDMAQFLADNGVNLVIGTHPHVIEPARYIGDTLVYYSLGNLLCAQMQDEEFNKVTSVLSTFTVNMTKQGGETKITFDNMDNQLLLSYYNPIMWNDYKIIPFSSDEIKDYMPDYKYIYEKYKANFLALDDTLPFADCAE